MGIPSSVLCYLFHLILHAYHTLTVLIKSTVLHPPGQRI